MEQFQHEIIFIALLDIIGSLHLIDSPQSHIPVQISQTPALVDRDVVTGGNPIMMLDH